MNIAGAVHTAIFCSGTLTGLCLLINPQLSGRHRAMLVTGAAIAAFFAGIAGVVALLAPARVDAALLIACGVTALVVAGKHQHELTAVLGTRRRSVVIAYGVVALVTGGALGVPLMAAPGTSWLPVSFAGLVLLAVAVILSHALGPRRAPAFTAPPADSPARTETGQKLLVIGMDSASWPLVNLLLEREQLPNLARIAREGTMARLDTLRPTWSPVVWTCIATGRLPAAHGIIDFVTRRLPGTADALELILPRDLGVRRLFHELHRIGFVRAAPVGSAQRVTPAFWETCTHYGQECSVVNWHATAPPEPIRGYAVSDLFVVSMTDLPAGSICLTHPPILAEDTQRLRPPADGAGDPAAAEIVRAAETAGHNAHQMAALRTAFSEDRWCANITQDLLRRNALDVAAVVLYNLDKVQHLFWEKGHDKNHLDPDHVVGSVIGSYYRWVDSLVGELIAAAGPEYNVVVLSDHGMETASRWEKHRTGHAGAHEEAPPGVIFACGPAIAKQAALESASILDVAPTMHAIMGWPLPRDLDGVVLERLLRPEFLSRYPVRRIASNLHQRLTGDRAAVDHEGDELMKRLKALGYLG